MAQARMVMIQNMVNKTVGVKYPEYGVNRKWTKKGQTIPLPYDVVEQLLWAEGFKNMIDRGILYIADMKDKIDLGLEPYGAEKPENIRVFTPTELDNLLRNVPFVVFKKEIEGVGEVQLREMVNYAIANRIVDIEKANLLYELTDLDIIKSITKAQDIERAEAVER